MVSPLCLLPSFLTWCYNMASALFPSFQVTLYFLQLSLLPGCLCSLQEIILMRVAQRDTLPSLLPGCHTMATAEFPFFHLTSYFLQLSLFPGCLGSLQEIILVRGPQHGVRSVPSLHFLPGATTWVPTVPIFLSYLVFSSTVSPP
jgi:hypothetical protein